MMWYHCYTHRNAKCTWLSIVKWVCSSGNTWTFMNITPLVILVAQWISPHHQTTTQSQPPPKLACTGTLSPNEHGCLWLITRKICVPVEHSIAFKFMDKWSTDKRVNAKRPNNPAWKLQSCHAKMSYVCKHLLLCTILGWCAFIG